MGTEALLTLAILGVSMALFATDRLRLDVIALGVLLSLVLFGILPAGDALAGFSDPLVDCRTCKKRFREDEIKRKEGKAPQCPHCGGVELGDVRQFNLMFKTFMGPIEEQAAVVYMRPETAQGIYVNFHNVRETARRKLPFGIAQIGKAFRNEITPGNIIFRTREFEQMEMQYFVKPGEDERFMEYWRAERMQRQRARRSSSYGIQPLWPRRSTSSCRSSAMPTRSKRGSRTARSTIRSSAVPSSCPS